jgi:hypothetical protein
MTTRGSLVYIVLPTVASAVAGGLWGRAIIDEAKTNSIRQSLLRGIFVGMSAFLIFSLLFALALPFVEHSICVVAAASGSRAQRGIEKSPYHSLIAK